MTWGLRMFDESLLDGQMTRNIQRGLIFGTEDAGLECEARKRPAVSDIPHSATPTLLVRASAPLLSQ